jgi:hypothetical protein
VIYVLKYLHYPPLLKTTKLSTAYLEDGQNHRRARRGVLGGRVGAALSVSQFHIMSVAVVFMPLYPALCPSHLLSLLCLAASIWDKIMRTDIAQPSLWRCRAGAGGAGGSSVSLYHTTLSSNPAIQHIGAVQCSAVQCSAMQCSAHRVPGRPRMTSGWQRCTLDEG